MSTGRFQSNRRRNNAKACPGEQEKENHCEMLGPLPGHPPRSNRDDNDRQFASQTNKSTKPSVNNVDCDAKIDWTFFNPHPEKV